ncbi:MAG: quinolinate synthase NadA [Phycisphaeraceae bacterium]|nr:quinolinate synthase NadA [Phycisphaeraceae bacterium]
MKSDLIEKIKALKTRRKAVVLAHNYQSPEIQDLADFAGDSLGLSVQAAQTDAEVIVFCGVRFMAETAVILSPDKAVLLPDKHAGCPMADMITVDELREHKANYPGALVVCYVNSTADVKALSDYCCTSSNALELVRTLPTDKPILFVPDQNLGNYVKQRCPEHDIVLWPGFCRSHILITAQDVRDAKAAHPGAVVLAHPECKDEVKDLADELLSTGQMLTFVKTSAASKYIIATEVGILHSLKKANPEAGYVAASERAYCENMKKITVEKVLWALEDMVHPVTVPQDVSVRAKLALDRMIAVLPKI